MERAYKYLLLKTYFDTGLGLTSYFKYLLAIFGVYSIGEGISFDYFLWVGVSYVLFCFILGWAWYKFKLVEVQNEIGNRFNPFQREVREKLKLNTKFK